MNLWYDTDAVVVRDGEVVIKDPAGRVELRTAAQIRGERVKVSHVTVSEEKIVPWTVHIVSDLNVKHKENHLQSFSERTYMRVYLQEEAWDQSSLYIGAVVLASEGGRRHGQLDSLHHLQ